MLHEVQTLDVDRFESPTFPTDGESKISAYDEQGRPTQIPLNELAFFDVALDPNNKDSVLQLSELDGYSWHTFQNWAVTRRTPYEILATAWIWFQTTLDSSYEIENKQCSGILLLSWHEFCHHIWNFFFWVNKRCQQAQSRGFDSLTAIENPEARCAVAELAQLVYWTLACFKEDVVNEKVPRTGRDVRSWQIEIAKASRKDLCIVAKQLQAELLLRNYIETADEDSDVDAMRNVELLFRTQLLLSSLPANQPNLRKKFVEQLNSFQQSYVDDQPYFKRAVQIRQKIFKCLTTNEIKLPNKVCIELIVLNFYVLHCNFFDSMT